MALFGRAASPAVDVCLGETDKWRDNGAKRSRTTPPPLPVSPSLFDAWPPPSPPLPPLPPPSQLSSRRSKRRAAYHDTFARVRARQSGLSLVAQINWKPCHHSSSPLIPLLSPSSFFLLSPHSPSRGCHGPPPPCRFCDHINSRLVWVGHSLSPVEAHHMRCRLIILTFAIAIACPAVR